MSTEAIRREHIATMMTKIIRVGSHYTVAELLFSLLRRKNFSTDPYKATDEQVSSALEDMLEELKEDSQDVFHEKNNPNGQA